MIVNNELESTLKEAVLLRVVGGSEGSYETSEAV
jgi:hypothetical protein